MTEVGARILRETSVRYGLEFDAESTLHGGEESSVTRVRSGDASFIVRVSPAWRTLAELAWAYELAAFAATEIPEALAPVRARDGSLAFEQDGRVVSVFPFVDGEVLDRSSERERDSAARLLARLHRVLPSWPNARPRPASRPNVPVLVPRIDPPGLADPALDAAVHRLSVTATPALAHGDYYRGNVRCVDHRIVALFDWDDLGVWTLENELAWSVWEFTQADDAATLDLSRARRFLDVYSASGGTAPLGDLGFIVPFIRDDIRTEIREAAAMAEAGHVPDPVYVQRSNEAFVNLARVTF
jgi:Ser/Thr protein kinase RdoA (MazF antagonist)